MGGRRRWLWRESSGREVDRSRGRAVERVERVERSSGRESRTGERTFKQTRERSNRREDRRAGDESNRRERARPTRGDRLPRRLASERDGTRRAGSSLTGDRATGLLARLELAGGGRQRVFELAGGCWRVLAAGCWLLAAGC